MQTLQAKKMFKDLIDSIINNDLSKMKTLIDQGVNVNSFEDYAKIRPLHFAVQYERMEAIKLLITAGADPTELTAEEETPLDIALLYKNKEIIQFLEKITLRNS